MDLKQRISYELSTFYHRPHPINSHLPLTELRTVAVASAGYLVCTLLLVLTVKRLHYNTRIFDLPIKLYNAVQIGTNGFVFTTALMCIIYRSSMEDVLCLPVVPETPLYPTLDRLEAWNNWLFFLNKYLDFLDTFWIVVRKRTRQLTFLHMYHHASVLFVFWPIVRFIPTGVSTWNCVLNSFIHVLMYAYYLLSAHPELRRMVTSYKPMLTRLQMLQFAFLILVSCVAGYRIHVSRTCRHSVLYGAAMNVYGVSLLLLFARFYRRAYPALQQAKTE